MAVFSRMVLNSSPCNHFHVKEDSTKSPKNNWAEKPIYQFSKKKPP